ncbi:trefoil factor 3 isoform X2 [Bombina bombina]|uniref:trefoil factor 3 isoform X2 n=1 Tax=Bombina bombina TaxID=8345 RepID=UPI00235A8F61|nr:trefoil factor 3 isoform X2 [Bombina bombina]
MRGSVCTHTAPLYYRSAVLEQRCGAVYRCSSLNPQERIECGNPRITKEDCNSKGCCFDSYTPSNIVCFKPTLIRTEGGANAVIVNPQPAIQVIHKWVPAERKSPCQICKEEKANKESPGLIKSVLNIFIGESESEACAQCRQEVGLSKDTSIFGSFLS